MFYGPFVCVLQVYLQQCLSDVYQSYPSPLIYKRLQAEASEQFLVDDYRMEIV